MPSRATSSNLLDSGNTEVMQSARGLLALQGLPRVGAKTALRIALTLDYDSLLEQHAEKWPKALKKADEQLERCAEQEIEVLSIFDERYPERLRGIHDPPPLLFLHGSLEAVDGQRSVAVVGTREPTQFGCSAADALVAAVAGAQWTVVSGLARGIDTMAHGAALKHHTPTIGVMAGGLDDIYPKENRELAAAIVDQGGALVSEQPVGTRPRASSFVARNRIQTGLAAAVLVIQTGLKGGTMHTARHAAAQGRPIFCPVPRSSHEKNEGLRALLERPGDSLCQVLPAWRDAGELCRRLGDWPVAHPVAKNDIESFLEQLEFCLEAPARSPQGRWWATPEFPHEEPPAEVAVFVGER